MKFIEVRRESMEIKTLVNIENISYIEVVPSESWLGDAGVILHLNCGEKLAVLDAMEDLMRKIGEL